MSGAFANFDSLRIVLCSTVSPAMQQMMDDDLVVLSFHPFSEQFVDELLLCRTRPTCRTHVSYYIIMNKCIIVQIVIILIHNFYHSNLFEEGN